MGCGSSTIEKPDVSIAKSEHGSIKKLRPDWEFMGKEIDYSTVSNGYLFFTILV